MSKLADVPLRLRDWDRCESMSNSTICATLGLVSDAIDTQSLNGMGEFLEPMHYPKEAY